ncbi:Exosome complex component RRP45 [Habropoda laboriosa]|uniref:Exosome complex component RRP45 n=1 Tax=Habropoda laboriosa TaxID=597456 RepID=A0A0L7RKD4_9HYME|nr:PREDICTED: exosome complex component rrp45 [Habropoda laboriosa]KOC71294.1 Exosome complex component RRP45 [Habropoda laboriosa]
MKEVILSNCEKNFVNKSVKQGTRLDGRNLLQARPVKIYFGSNWGSCIVSLGQTRVIVQVTCDIQQPKTSRSNEGMLHINVELNPLAAQHFDSGKLSEFSILISRQLEKCFKDSKCIDLESLCIIVDKKVWNIRVDINIINHDGNLIDCASIATLAALSHFHRPDVTSNGEDIMIHPFSEKDPLPLTLYHYPVCVSFITFESGNTVMDPTYIEERVGVAQLTLGINSYRELCSLHFNYLTKTMTVEDVISAVSNYAANYAAKLVQQIKEVVVHDVEARYRKDNRNINHFKECIMMKNLTTMNSDCINIKLHKWDEIHKVESDAYMEKETIECKIIKPGEGSAELITNTATSFGEGGSNTWNISESSEEEVSDIEIAAGIQKEENKVANDIELSGDSEEETTEILETKDLIQ